MNTSRRAWSILPPQDSKKSLQKHKPHNVISLVRGVRSFSRLYIIMCSVVLRKQNYFGHMLSVIILRLNLIYLGKLILLIRQNWRLSATLNCQGMRSVKNKFRRNIGIGYFTITVFYVCLLLFYEFVMPRYFVVVNYFRYVNLSLDLLRFFCYFYLGTKTVCF